MRHLADAGATLLITVDCGISATAEVELASQLGMDCVILDHHEPPDRVPPAIALVNPKLPGSEYGSEPAACAIAFKAMREVASVLGTAWKQAREHLALAAMGSVCDMVPLRGEQRDLIRVGLPILRRTRRPGLRAIASVAGFAMERVTEHECGWGLGPRINAAGRIEHAREAFAVLRASTAAEAMVLATRLEASVSSSRVASAGTGISVCASRAVSAALRLASSRSRVWTAQTSSTSPAVKPTAGQRSRSSTCVPPEQPRIRPARRNKRPARR